MDLQVFSTTMLLKSCKGHSLQLAEFKDHPANPLIKGSCQT